MGGVRGGLSDTNVLVEEWKELLVNWNMGVENGVW